MNIVILGLTITSDLGNSHAATYRGLVRELNRQGHRVMFLECDMPFYASNRDLPAPDFCELGLFTSVDELRQKYTEQVREADLVMLGTRVPEGVQVGEWMLKTAQGLKVFYDLDTPVTLAQLKQESCEYLTPSLIPKFDLYLTVTGGYILQMLESKYGAPMARPLYHSFDPCLYYPAYTEIKWDLGYLDKYNEANQPLLEHLMLDAARQWKEGRFAVAGSPYPESINWPPNTLHIPHLPPSEQRQFYNSQRFALNINKAHTPSRQLFAAMGCCTPIISNHWEGLESFFEIGEEVLVANSATDTLSYLRGICKSERKLIGERGRKKVLANHTVAHRVQELLSYAEELMTVEKATDKVVS